jgi:hypothetical protein
MTSKEDLKQEGWKLLNKCPVCGSKLNYCAEMSSTIDYQLKRDGMPSVRGKRTEAVSMECGYLACQNPECDFLTDCYLKARYHWNIEIKERGGVFFYREEVEEDGKTD